MPSSKCLATAVLICAAWAGAPLAVPQARFHVYPLDFAGAGQAINHDGRVVGVSLDNQRAFITGPNGRGATPLGSLGRYTWPNDINDAGVVVGHSDGRAFITDAGGQNMREIVMPERNLQSEAVAVNRRGQVVGVYYTRSPLDPPVDDDFHAFITEPDGLNARRIDGFNAARTMVYAINGRGQVTGDSVPPDGSSRRAFVTGPNGLGLTEIDRAGAESLTIMDINDSGQIGGAAWYPTGQYEGNFGNPFIGDLGQPIEIKRTLGGLTGHLEALNARGDHVGSAGVASEQPRAYVSTRSGEPVRLDALVRGLADGDFFTTATDINDRR